MDTSANDTIPKHEADPEVIVVLPAYNEEKNLTKLLERIDRTMVNNGIPYKTIVVDDGSKDKTVQVAEACSLRMPVTLFRHPVNRGLGMTIRDALHIAVEQSTERGIIVTMDADNTHPPELIPSMVKHVENGGDVIIASRYRKGSGVRGLSFHRLLLSFGARILFQLTFPTPGVRDFTCGYRVYRSAIIRNAYTRYGNSFISESGFQCMVDILLKLRRMKCVFREVPLMLRYDKKEGTSKMKICRTVWKTCLLLIKRRFGQ
jgi:dolichol-phosphate mannosyltransferase